MTFIQVDNLCKNYEYYEKELGLKASIKNIVARKKLIKEAVKNVSFNIDKGEIVGFIGPNGAGKTTTLKLLSGILFPTSGQVSIDGYIPWERKDDFKKEFAIVMGQKSQLWWDLPANESLYLNKCIYEIDDKSYQKNLDELTEMLDVKDLLKKQVRRLSLGERMKLELIASLIHKPKIILLDEPTIGLDVVSQKRIRDFLKKYNKENKITIILTSHYMSDIEDLCKRVIIINNGEVLQDGNIEDFSTKINSNKYLTASFSEYVDSERMTQIGRLIESTGYVSKLEVNKGNIASCAKELLDNFPVVDLNIEGIPLEDTISTIFQERN